MSEINQLITLKRERFHINIRQQKLEEKFNQKRKAHHPFPNQDDELHNLFKECHNDKSKIKELYPKIEC